MIPRRYLNKVARVEKVEGMCTSTGTAWEAILTPGFQHDGTHVITTDSWRELLGCLPGIEPCTCSQCKSPGGN